MKACPFTKHTPPKSNAPLPFPQEIIDLIIDELIDEKDPCSSQRTLRACSLVHSAFSDRSQKHLFADITFTADSSTQARAGRLVRIYKTRPDLFNALQRFKFYIKGAPAHTQRMLSELQDSQASRTLLFAMLFVLGFDGGQISLAKSIHIPRLLHMVSHAPNLIAVSLKGERGHEFDWRLWNERTQGWIGEVCKNPRVTHLELENLNNLPARIFEDVFEGVRGAIKVQNCTFYTNTDGALPSAHKRLSWAGSLGNVERLAITETPYAKFMATLHRAVFGTDFQIHTITSPGGGDQILRFDKLTTLVISLQHGGELGGVWCLISGAAHSLMKLEMLDMGFSEAHQSIAPISLARLPRLCHLKICTYPSPYLLDARAAGCFLRFVAVVLRNASTAPPEFSTQPSALQAVEISLSMRFTRTNNRHGNQFTKIDSANAFGIDHRAWRALDDALSFREDQGDRESFPALKDVSVRVALKKDDEWWSTCPSEKAGQGGASGGAVLPDTAGCGWVGVKVITEYC